MAREYSIYVTQAGDTFDSIALDFYGDENYSVFIMQVNPDLISTLIFEYGIELKIPDIDVKNTSTLPPWKR